MIILGAGMSGLIAAHILRRHNPVIHEAAPELPNNHNALLRFPTDAASAATGIPFRKVRVDKAVMSEGKLRSKSTLDDCNRYSYKVTGKYSSRSIGNLDSVHRYIAPPDFIAQMARSCNIQYNRKFTSMNLGNYHGGPPLTYISTIPMPAMMDIVGWHRRPEFNYRSIKVITAELRDTDLYQTIYYPELDTPVYRASITGANLIVEVVLPDLSEFGGYAAGIAYCDQLSEEYKDLRQIVKDFGIVEDKIKLDTVKATINKYGKISPVEDDILRRSFILALTDKYKIYSLGRFAVWRQILTDDVVADVAKIDGWISDRDAYAYRQNLTASSV